MKLQAWNQDAARAARRVLEYNPYHGKDGKFTGKSGAASTSVYSGKPSLGNRKDATAAELAYRKGRGVESPLLRQDDRSHDGGRMDLSWHREASRSYGRARKLTGDARRREREGAEAQARNAEIGARKPKPPEYREHVPQDPGKYTRGKRVYPGKPIPERAQAFERSRRSEYERTQSLAPYAKSIRQTQHDSSATRYNYHASAARNFGQARRLLASSKTDLRLGYGDAAARASRDARSHAAVGKQDRRYARTLDMARAIGTGKSRRQERNELANKKKDGTR